MKTLLPLFFIVVLAACGGNSTSSDKGKSPETAQNDQMPEIKEPEDVPLQPNDAVDTLTPKQLKKLGKYLSQRSVKQLSDYMNTLRFAQTDTAVELAYHNAKPLIEQLEKELRKKNDDPSALVNELEFMEDIFAIRPSCVAECTEFVLNYDYEDFIELAKETQGDADDQFFKMKMTCEGEEGTYHPGWLTFFERTWDYGGGVNLGDNTIYAFLKDSYNFQKKSKLFKADIDELRSETIGVMEHPVYMYSKDKVQAEIDKIVKQNIVSAAEKKRILKVKSRNEIEDTKSQPLLQFGCKTGDCDWGG